MAMTVRPVDPLAFEQSKDPAYEFKNHLAFYPHATKENAEKLLLGTLPLTYMLRTMQGVEDGAISEQYYLSYMRRDLEVEHVILFPHHVILSALIPLVMNCPPNECKMLLNPCHFRK